MCFIMVGTFKPNKKTKNSSCEEKRIKDIKFANLFTYVMNNTSIGKRLSMILESSSPNKSLSQLIKQ